MGPVEGSDECSRFADGPDAGLWSERRHCGRRFAYLPDLPNLAVSKGDKDTQVGKICPALGLPVKKDGSCLVYQTLYKDESGRLHSINVLNRAGKATRYVFFFLHDDIIGKAWLIDEEGGCKRRRPAFTKTNGLGARSLSIRRQRTDLPRRSIIGAPKRTSWRTSPIARIDRRRRRRAENHTNSF